MHVAVAIVGYRNADDIQRCLAALALSDHADFEVVICENGGAEAFAHLKAVIPTSIADSAPVRVIEAPGNLGYAGGVNVCLAAAPDADAWWVLNPDTEPYPQAMRRLAERLAVGDCDAVGSTIHLPSGRLQSHGGHWNPWLARAVSIGHGGALDPAPDPTAVEQRQNYLNGASMMVGRRFVQIVGPMREDYFLYCEEVEWCLRAAKLGLRLGFAPGALILHHQGTSTGNSVDFARRRRAPVFLNERNKLLLTRDCFPVLVPVAALSALLLMLYRYPRRRAWRQLSYGLAGWRAGLTGQRGPVTV